MSRKDEGAIKMFEKLKKWLEKKRKETKRNEKKKNSLRKTPHENFSNLSESSPGSPDLSFPSVVVGKYRLARQFKKESFTGIAVKLNVPKKKLPPGDNGYRGFIRPSIWRHYVLDGEKASEEKIEFMLRVSQQIRAGYADIGQVLTDDSGELPGESKIRLVK